MTFFLINVNILLTGDIMYKTIIKHLKLSIQIVCLIIAVMVVVGTSNGDETKVNNNNLNKSLDLRVMALKAEESINNDIYAAKDSYFGDLTGYVANCPLCGGHLACMPKLDVLSGITTYEDETYGSVRIVASSRNLACGSIVRFDSSIEEEPIVAIVLDRGVTGTNLDLLVGNVKEATKNIGRKKISYDVLRKGW